ncbi:MAG: pyruvate, phosphate dikinase [Planctomycetes bacterium]|nr:pyruvate, phosphate dikinase [Planctomycetota bacterium]
MTNSRKVQRWVYFFGGGKADGRGDQKELLGGKGAGLAEMTRIGLPVPAGFTITTQACSAYYEARKQWPAGLEKEVRAHVAALERTCGRKLGDPRCPLLVSVRSGAARSMPGMMETILNLGLNDASVEGLAAESCNRRFAFDAYRRLIMMYGATAKGIERARFEEALSEIKETRTRPRLARAAGERILDTEVDAGELEALVGTFKRIFREHAGEEFPQDPFTQLRGAIDAVFGSWMADKAVTYRRVENITGLTGTAVNVCQMVFGNMGDDCGTGVCFTRDPSTGECVFYGDLLINAQGEDVVAGVRTPLRLAELQTRMPEVYEQLEAMRVMLEVHYKDMQDLEFTIERGKLYMLQCRVGKRSPQAAFKIAVDQASRGLLTAGDARRLVKKNYLPPRYARAASRPIITRDEAINRISAADVERLFYPVLDPRVESAELARRRVGTGIGAVPGAACGAVVFSAEEAEARARADQGPRVILVRKETSPEDVGGMHAAAGILTATGGKTSHAAVVARGWGKCCIVGCDALNINYAERTLSLNGRVIREGEIITLDGGSGSVYEGEIPLVRPAAPPEHDTLMGWCDQRRRLRVRANADTPGDAVNAVRLGAEGIGLCRTEHMFFDPAQPQRIRAMREMILADSAERRRAALEKLLPFQRQDFEGIFAAMNGLPVTIRLLDPPLHEFLPHDDNPDGQQAVADELNQPVHEALAKVEGWDELLRKSLQAKLVTRDDIRRRVSQLHEANPMLGHRGCRLCITFPEILDMQVRAIIEAAANGTRRGIKVLPEIMIPLSIDGAELALLLERVRHVADAVLRERGVKIPYLAGTMIETPRAALLADRLAESAEFFSFGTNDLTQMTMGLSRDDAGRFLPDYLHAPRIAGTATSAEAQRPPIFPHDPFQSIDADGVGMLVRMACAKGRLQRRRLKLGVCGEHGGDPGSIAFFEQAELDYVSCSPFRVPIARLAAAQAAIAGGRRPGRVPAKRPQPTPNPEPARVNRKPSDGSPRRVVPSVIGAPKKPLPRLVGAGRGRGRTP